MKCKYCYRKLPNKTFKTKDGCIWCDFYYLVKKYDVLIDDNAVNYHWKYNKEELIADITLKMTWSKEGK